MRQILSQQIDQQYERSKYPENNAWFFLKTFKKILLYIKGNGIMIVI